MKQIFIVGLMLLLGAPTILPAEEAISAKVILRDPRDLVGKNQERAPALIPTRLLETPYDEWSVDNRSRAPRKYSDKFNDMVDRVRALGTSGECSPGKGIPEKSGVPKPGERRFSIFEVAGREKNILVGEVVATEPAWDPLIGQIYTLVHLKVQRVVRAFDPINVGDIVTYHRPWGTVTIRGITLCSYANGNSPSLPRPGREAPERLRPTFLILGRLVPGNSLFISTHDYEEFQIIEGLAHYPPGISLYYESKPENLEGLFLRLQESSQ